MLPPDVTAEIERADPAKRAKITALLAQLEPRPRPMSDPGRACPVCSGITYIVSLTTMRRHCPHCRLGFQP